MLSHIQQQHSGKAASLRQKLQILGFEADDELIELLSSSSSQFDDQLMLEDYILPEAFALMQQHSISVNCLNDSHHKELLCLPSVQIQQRCSSIQAEINAFESQNSLFPKKFPHFYRWKENILWNLRCFWVNLKKNDCSSEFCHRFS